MSAKLVGWALQAGVENPDLQPVERLLLVVLADHFNDDEGAAWPSQERLAALVGVSSRHIRRLLDVLKDKGLIHVERRELGASNVYTLSQTPHRTPKSYRTPMSSPPGHTRPIPQDTDVLLTLNNSYRTRRTSEIKTPMPPKYKPPKNQDAVEPEQAQEIIKKIKKNLKKKP